MVLFSKATQKGAKNISKKIVNLITLSTTHCQACLINIISIHVVSHFPEVYHIFGFHLLYKALWSRMISLLQVIVQFLIYVLGI
jgi:hypothetical protein